MSKAFVFIQFTLTDLRVDSVVAPCNIFRLIFISFHKEEAILRVCLREKIFFTLLVVNKTYTVSKIIPIRRDISNQYYNIPFVSPKIEFSQRCDFI